MKFHKRPNYGDFQDTRRKRLAAARRLLKEQRAFPLFAAQIAARQPTIDEIMQGRAAQWQIDEFKARAFHAERWRKLRARFYALPRPIRDQIRARAQTYGGPLTTIAYDYLIREVSKTFDSAA